eukprot:gnl/TRDRNA2_/TRDRNA2_85997_c1_seq1.p1 gnl/TRDRNA2_/TRDRNA2_85997_c1~~gnl/TRDRNA2_/TRDRNA2_85997_c1_seq1.p1  ORF type:complete len:332 (+),score=57.07 gnl/TRDRNA2_/TRDRNA2_85997_c1_seq1:89-1084(+)
MAFVDEDGEAVPCWICLGNEKRDAKLGALRSPCACKGSMGRVHERCLQEWVLTHSTEVTPGLPSCPTCKERYHGDVVLLLAAASTLRLNLELPSSVHTRLVTALQQRQMSREATALLRRGMRWNQLIADPTHPDTLQGLCNVAAAMGEIRQWDAECVLLRRVLKCCERLRGSGGGGSKVGHSWWACMLPWNWEIVWVGDDAVAEELEFLEYERQCVRAIASDAAKALSDTLTKQGRVEEAERQLGRGRAFDREEQLVSIMRLVEGPVLFVLRLVPWLLIGMVMILINRYCSRWLVWPVQVGLTVLLLWLLREHFLRVDVLDLDEGRPGQGR